MRYQLFFLSCAYCGADWMHVRNKNDNIVLPQHQPKLVCKHIPVAAKKGIFPRHCNIRRHILPMVYSMHGRRGRNRQLNWHRRHDKSKKSKKAEEAKEETKEEKERKEKINIWQGNTDGNFEWVDLVEKHGFDIRFAGRSAFLNLLAKYYHNSSLACGNSAADSNRTIYGVLTRELPQAVTKINLDLLPNEANPLKLLDDFSEDAVSEFLISDTGAQCWLADWYIRNKLLYTQNKLH